MHNAHRALFASSMQLPIYFVVSLGCYGLLMVGVGLMQFPTCPQEALLLQQVVIIFSDHYILLCYNYVNIFFSYVPTVPVVCMRTGLTLLHDNMCAFNEFQNRKNNYLRCNVGQKKISSILCISIFFSLWIWANKKVREFWYSY